MDRTRILKSVKIGSMFDKYEQKMQAYSFIYTLNYNTLACHQTLCALYRRDTYLSTLRVARLLSAQLLR